MRVIERENPFADCRPRLYLDDGVSRYYSTVCSDIAEHESGGVLPFGAQPLLYCRILMRERTRPGCHHLRINQNFFALEHVRAGNLFFRQNGRTYLAEPGDVCLMHCRSDSEFLTGPAGFCLKSSLLIEGPLIGSAIGHSGLGAADIVTLRDGARLEACIDRLAEAMRNREPAASDRAVGLSLEAIQILASHETSGSLPATVTRALEWMERRLDSALTVPELARELKVSVSTLSRLFMENLKVTPYRCLIRLRMRRAARLLIESDDSVKEIALAAGYGNALNFSTEFRKFFGVSPRHYRARSGIAP